MSALAAPRWAVSFADLGLLLLACFVLLHALHQARPDAGATEATAGATLAAADLFEPGEARLTETGKAEIAALARRAGGARVEVTGIGAAERNDRLDAFELAAARAAAVARALKEAGVAEESIALAQRQGADGQRIRIALRP